MELPPLTDGFILRRYKRFLADVELQDGRSITAHCPNTGRMTSCWESGAAVQLSYSDNPQRKLPWTLERVDMGSGWIGVNTQRANGVIAEAITEGLIPTLSGYRTLRREAVFSSDRQQSRLDILLQQGTRPDAYVEIKTVTLLLDSMLQFPDAVSERGLKHLNTLMEIQRSGLRAVMLFALNRPEGGSFRPADSVDPAYAETLRRAATSGVEVLAVRLVHTETGIQSGEQVPIEL